MELPKSNLIHSSIIVSAIAVFILLWAIRFFNIALPISITTKQETSSELSVVGDGKVDVIPDTATVSVGITVTNAATATEAQSKATQINNAIISALTTLGIDKKDIKTTDYSISPSYNYSTGQNTVSGYNATASVSIKVTNTALLPQVIQAATDAGANQINNTEYSVDNPEKFREQARSMAIQNAKDQAQKLANQLGIRLGKITNIVESNQGVPEPLPFRAGGVLDASMSKSVAPNLEAGSQTITSEVTLFFEKN